MSDRELLELAAKAAGIEGKWAEWDHAYGDYREYGLDYGGRTLWNPLNDDGDALRLAVKLKLELQVFEDVVSVNWPLNSISTRLVPDPYAATRRAIVRAAAEIGRQMQEGEEA